MDSTAVRFGLLLVLFGVTSAKAADADLAEGQRLYNKECSVCHGVLASTKTSELAPAQSRRFEYLAMAPSAGFTVPDYHLPLSNDLHEPHLTARDRVAVVPLYGPPLKELIGRVAGTFDGYTFSKAFLKKMEGIAWNESNLDAWIKSSQTMVPGSFMFYSQKKADVRSNIIEYLKAQPH